MALVEFLELTEEKQLEYLEKLLDRMCNNGLLKKSVGKRGEPIYINNNGD